MLQLQLKDIICVQRSLTAKKGAATKIFKNFFS